jgi:hypothetical protein
MAKHAFSRAHYRRVLHKSEDEPEAFTLQHFVQARQLEAWILSQASKPCVICTFLPFFQWKVGTRHLPGQVEATQGLRLTVVEWDSNLTLTASPKASLEPLV